MSALTYKDYTAAIEYDSEEESFFGRVVNISDVITFYGKSVKDLQREMKISVDTYLEFCREKGKNPDKPYSGKFMVRVDPKLHKRVEAATHVTGAQSMNAFVSEALERRVSEVESQK